YATWPPALKAPACITPGQRLGFGIDRCALEGCRNPPPLQGGRSTSDASTGHGPRGIAPVWAPGWHAPRRWRVYSPGVMRCAVDVPAFMIHAVPCLLLSGNPVEAVVAPGKARVMCTRACSWSAPITWYHTDPYSGFTRVPSFSAASSSA